jgi:hypothetical protein
LRAVVHYVLGLITAALSGLPRGHTLGLSLLPMGYLGIAVGIMGLLRAPGELGSAVLLSACLSAILGELLGGRALARLAGGSEPRRVQVDSVVEGGEAS